LGIKITLETGQNIALKAQVDFLRYRNAESIVDASINTIPYSERSWVAVRSQDHEMNAPVQTDFYPNLLGMMTVA
jgi:hypothetical protein